VTALRTLAHVASVLALAALAFAVGRWLRDPAVDGELAALVVVAIAVGLALRRLYGPEGVAALRRRGPARPVAEERPAEPETEPHLWSSGG
jgi:hypothetical protein